MNKPIVAISLKMYFTRKQTLAYCRRLADLLNAVALPLDKVTMAVLPDYLTVEQAGQALLSADVHLGIQDVCDQDRGPFTGEVSPLDAFDLGVTVAEVGHEERRRMYGEDDELIGRKVRACWRNGLTPLLCVGELINQGPDAAADYCLKQIEMGLGEKPDLPAWIAYEPVWAVGASSPAPVEYVRKVCSIIKNELGPKCRNLSLIYGGAAAPGLLTELWPTVDGVFLGRFAHDPAAFLEVVKEAWRLVSQDSEDQVGRS